MTEKKGYRKIRIEWVGEIDSRYGEMLTQQEKVAVASYHANADAVVEGSMTQEEFDRRLALLFESPHFHSGIEKIEKKKEENG